jgi:hypothetical protein
MTDKSKPAISNRPGVDKFLQKVARTPTRRDALSRLLFGMDATASREPTWDRACHLQGQMFETTASVGNLSVQLCYYRGFNEFKASAWCQSATSLLQEMSAVKCLGGYTQINKILDHAVGEHKRNRLRAVVFVGDALEEDADRLCHIAGQLGVLQVPLFMFHEGRDQRVQSVFQQMADLSGGAYAPFDLTSATELNDLLSAVAIFATGGKSALRALTSSAGPVGILTHQLRDL